MSIPADDLRRAKQAGRFAARRGLDATVCPYSLNGSDRDRALAHTWLAAYLDHTRDDPVDYSG